MIAVQVGEGAALAHAGTPWVALTAEACPGPGARWARREVVFRDSAATDFIELVDVVGGNAVIGVLITIGHGDSVR